jgi:hypothetical protein
MELTSDTQSDLSVSTPATEVRHDEDLVLAGGRG